MQQLYSSTVLDHFYHPRNMGELPNANGIARVGNRVCGDVMEMRIKVGIRKAVGQLGSLTAKEKNKRAEKEAYIEDAKFKTLGCGAAIATSSIATEMIKGKTLEEALKLTNQAVAEALGGLPPAKMHCSVLAADAVKKAIADYRHRSSLTNDQKRNRGNDSHGPY